MTKEELKKFQEKTKVLARYHKINDQIKEIIDNSRLSKEKKWILKGLIEDLLIIQSEIDTF